MTKERFHARSPRAQQMALKSLQVKKILVAERENPIVNRLNKTKVERFPDLQQEKEASLREDRKRVQANQRARVSFPLPIPMHELGLTSAKAKR